MSTEEQPEFLNPWIVTVLDWAEDASERVPALGLLTLCSGAMEGSPDMILPVPSGRHCGVLLWFSDDKNGQMSEDQSDWHFEYCRANPELPYFVAVAYNGAMGAIRMLEEYLKEDFQKSRLH